LIEALGDESVEVRLGAASALGKIGDVRAVESLIQALGDEDRGVRQAASEALVKIRGPAEVNVLQED
jgi:HEAT repeat protein